MIRSQIYYITDKLDDVVYTVYRINIVYMKLVVLSLEETYWSSIWASSSSIWSMISFSIDAFCRSEVTLRLESISLKTINVVLVEVIRVVWRNHSIHVRQTRVSTSMEHSDLESASKKWLKEWASKRPTSTSGIEDQSHSIDQLQDYTKRGPVSRYK